MQRDLEEWNEDWGERLAWDKETAWTLAATLDTQAQVYNKRTGVERSFSLWTAHGIKAAHHRRPYLWYARLALAAMVSHHEAWVRTAA